MKKACISLAFVLIIIVSAISFAGTGGQTEYVRIHIRANSDSKTDQSIKYEVRDLVVSYLTPYLENVETKEEATKVIENQKTAVKRLIDGLLIRKGFTYSSNVRINNEYFPTRKYEQETLSAGYYDAVIVELGNAEGANWWCVVYPPLCTAAASDLSRTALGAGLTEDDLSLITGDGDGYVLRFRSLELWERLRQWLGK